jgi:DNA-binding CsgD family transcriptional regulator
LRRAKKPRPGDGPRVQQKIRDLAGKGATDREIGARLGITADSAYSLRRRLGIPSGKSVREAAVESGGTP